MWISLHWECGIGEFVVDMLGSGGQVLRLGEMVADEDEVRSETEMVSEAQKNLLLLFRGRSI